MKIEIHHNHTSQCLRSAKLIHPAIFSGSASRFLFFGNRTFQRFFIDNINGAFARYFGCHALARSGECVSDPHCSLFCFCLFLGFPLESSWRLVASIHRSRAPSLRTVHWYRSQEAFERSSLDSATISWAGFCRVTKPSLRWQKLEKR